MLGCERVHRSERARRARCKLNFALRQLDATSVRRRIVRGNNAVHLHANKVHRSFQPTGYDNMRGMVKVS